MAQHNKLGEWGEQKAIEYLMCKGYTIVEHDWKYNRRDLDIIAFKDRVMAFVEVKTRRNTVFALPEQSVDKKKMKSICLAANAYVRMRRIRWKIRFDIISVVGTNDEDCQISHIEDAFMPADLYR